MHTLYSLFSVIILEAICPFSAEHNNALINTLSASMVHISQHDILDTMTGRPVSGGEDHVLSRRQGEVLFHAASK